MVAIWHDSYGEWEVRIDGRRVLADDCGHGFWAEVLADAIRAAHDWLDTQPDLDAAGPTPADMARMTEIIVDAGRRLQKARENQRARLWAPHAYVASLDPETDAGQDMACWECDFPPDHAVHAVSSPEATENTQVSKHE